MGSRQSLSAWLLVVLLLGGCAGQDGHDAGGDGSASTSASPEPDVARLRGACLDERDLTSCYGLLRARASSGATEAFEQDLDEMRTCDPQHWLTPFMRGEYLRVSRDPRGAEREYLAALKLAVAAGDGTGEVNSRYVLGALALDDGRTDEAESRFDETVRLARRLGDAKVESRALYRLAWVYLEQARYLKQRDTLTALLGLIDEDENSYRARNVHYNLALALARLGDTRVAAGHYERVISLAEQADDAEFLTMGNLARGVLALDESDPGLARRFFEAAIGAAPGAERPDLEVLGRIHLGRALTRSGAVSAALERLHECADSATEHGAWTRMTYLVSLGDAERLAGDGEAAKRDYLEAERLSVEIHEPEVRVQSLAGLAAIERAADDLDRAVEHAAAAVDQVEALRSGIGALAERAHFLQARSEAFLVLAASLADRDPRSLDASFEVVEKAHARTLQEVLAADPGAPTPAATALAEVRSRLQPGDLLVSYLLGEDESLLFAVDRSSATVHTLASRAEIEAGVSRYLEVLQRPMTSLDARLDPKGDFTRLASAGHELYQALLGPVQRQLGRASRLIVVPDRRLHLVPFEVLIRRPPRAGESPDFLGLDLAIEYLPSAAFLETRARHAPSRVLVVAAEEAEPELGLAGLEHAGEEVAAVVAAYDPATIRVLRQPEATEAAVERALAEPTDVLHVVAHTVLRPGLGPQIILAAGRGGSATRLDAGDIGRLPRAPGLAVLSACETAQGELVGGEGILGLVRAFTLAGSGQVVASLWKVDDAASAELMGRFHAAVAQGIPASEALRLARAQTLADGFVHPFAWAPFVLYGTD